MDATEWAKGLHAAATQVRDAIRLWLPEPGQPNPFAEGAMSGKTPYLQVGVAVLALERQLATPTDLLALKGCSLDLVHQAKTILAEVTSYLIYDLRFGGGTWEDPVEVIEGEGGEIAGFRRAANHRWYPGLVSEVDSACRNQIDKAIEFMEKSGLLRSEVVPKKPVAKKTSKKAAPKRSCNDLMKSLIQSKHEALGWSIRTWRLELASMPGGRKFAIATIQGTPMWKELRKKALGLKTEAAGMAGNDRRRKPQHGVRD